MLAIRKFSFSIFLCIIFFQAPAQSIEPELKALAKLTDFTVQKLETDTFFTEKYLLVFKQNVDPNNPLAGKFEQRVFLSHKSKSRPVVVITEGYAANYASHPDYKNELSSYLNANQICIEHRYFGQSIPRPLDWNQLTIANAAADDHRIVTILKKIYTNKWISTGISKGGQTCMYYRYFYPEDVDISVAYVAPLNFSKADNRVYRFLGQVGDSASRAKVFNYQYEMLNHKSEYLQAFKDLVQKRNLSYRMGLLEAYELTVLEYGFAYWQWGSTPIDSIPKEGESAKKMVRHLDQVAGIDWVSDQGIRRMQAFFYQALTQIGFYGYDISKFKDVVSFAENPEFDFAMPENIKKPFDPHPMYKVDQFIRHQANHMLFIYGEDDPWSSTAVDVTYEKDVLKIVKPKGSHLTRIANLPEGQQLQVLETLNRWLGHQ